MASSASSMAHAHTRHVVFDPDGIRVIGEYVVARDGSVDATVPGDALSDVDTPDVRQLVYLNAFHLSAEVQGVWGTSDVMVYQLHVDVLGSVHAMTDDTGALVWTQDYLPFGEPLSERVFGAKPRYTFTGKPWDAGAGSIISMRGTIRPPLDGLPPRIRFVTVATGSPMRIITRCGMWTRQGCGTRTHVGGSRFRGLISRRVKTTRCRVP